MAFRLSNMPTTRQRLGSFLSALPLKCKASLSPSSASSQKPLQRCPSCWLVSGDIRRSMQQQRTQSLLTLLGCLLLAPIPHSTVCVIANPVQNAHEHAQPHTQHITYIHILPHISTYVCNCFCSFFFKKKKR